MNTRFVTALASMLFAVPALADVHCHGPHKEGNTWSLTCSEDGKGDADYQCNYRVTVKNADGQSETVDASGTVGQGQKDVDIWSAVQNGGSDIVSAKLDGGSCEQQ